MGLGSASPSLLESNMTINVTQTHIDTGKKFICNNCPIALALQDVGLTGIAVSDSFIYHSEGWFRTPREVKKFIIDFDSGRVVKPFTFTL